MTTLTASTSTRKRLTGLQATAFQHPSDRQAIVNLKRIKGFDLVMKAYLEYGYERIEYVLNTATNVKIGPKQLPRIYQMLRECCATLDMPEPDLYVGQGNVNAYTFGHTRPCIILYTELLDLITEEELMAVIAHETGHIKCGHVLYTQMARALATIGSLFLPGPLQLLMLPVQVGLTEWGRRAELSADRASLLVMQEPSPCISMLMKLGGGTLQYADELDPAEFLEQARHYGEDMDSKLSDRFYRFVAGTYRGSHPFIIERAKSLNEWSDHREFQDILDGKRS